MTSKFANRRKVFYAIDSYKDEESRENRIILCGVVTETFEDSNFHDRNLSIGMTIIRPDLDTDLSVKRGKEIAFARAMRGNSRSGKLSTKDFNMLNKTMVNNILLSEMAFIKDDPAKCVRLMGKKKAFRKSSANKELLQTA